MITIIIYKHIKLLITPLEWCIFPIVKRDWDKQFKVKQIEVAFKFDGTYGTHYVGRRVQTNFTVWVLFFRLHFLSWHTFKDVAEIFPANYNWKDDPDYDEKYQRLANTGYFA